MVGEELHALGVGDHAAGLVRQGPGYLFMVTTRALRAKRDYS